MFTEGKDFMFDSTDKCLSVYLCETTKHIIFHCTVFSLLVTITGVQLVTLMGYIPFRWIIQEELLSVTS